MTAHCTDKRFEDLLHAYELRMLSEDQARELEVHLLECEECFAKVEKMDWALSLVRNDSEIKAVFTESVTETNNITPRRRHWLSPVLTAAAVILLLILKPWQLEFSIDQKAIAADNRLAVMYFNNLADPDDSLALSTILPPLLTADLSESHFIQVVSSQRLFDIMKSIDSSHSGSIDRNLASEIARKAEARWMLIGSIVQVTPELTATIELVEVSTGNTVSSGRISVPKEKTVFDLVDRITVEVKEDMLLPQDALEEPDRLVSELTTNSKEAYRYYLEGTDYYYKFYYEEASQKFEQALRYDSTFAMAYYYLAMVKSRSYLDQAVALIDHAGEKGAYLIRSLAASNRDDLNEAKAELLKCVDRFPDDKMLFLRLGQYSYRQTKYNETLGYLNRALAIDPAFKSAYNARAYAYNALGDIDNAIAAIDMYISLAPNEPNPYDSRGDIYYTNHRFAEAIESFKIAIEKKPDYNNSWFLMAHSMLVTNRLAEADSCYRHLEISDKASTRQMARYYRGQVFVRKGRLAEAILHYDNARRLAVTDSVLPYPSHDFMVSVMLDELHDYQGALSHVKSAIRIRLEHDSTDHEYGRAHYIRLLASNGLMDEALEAADSLKVYLMDNGLPPTQYEYALGCVAESRNEPTNAIMHYTLASADTSDIAYAAKYRLARVQQENNLLDDARDNFEHVISDDAIWRDYWDILGIKAYYYLGNVYSDLGRPDDAIKMYTAFLDRWKDGDTNIPEIARAKTKLNRLKTGP